jgi:hypothetical protein
MHGYLSEHHSFGETDERAGEYAEDLAASMLATTLGIESNPELDWDEREQIFKMSGKIVRTTNITQSAVGNKDGLWTTVFAAAVFINDDNLPVETGKPQGDVDWGNGDASQDEISRQVPEPQEPAARQPEGAARSRQARSDGKDVHPPVGHGHQQAATHDQQEVGKALHRALRQRVEPSPRAKDTATADGVLKARRVKLPRPL